MFLMISSDSRLTQNYPEDNAVPHCGDKDYQAEEESPSYGRKIPGLSNKPGGENLY